MASFLDQGEQVTMYSAKNTIRVRMKKNREDYCKSLSDPSRGQIHTKIVQNVLNLIPVNTKGPVAGFWPLEFEPDIRSVLETILQQGRKALLPVIQEASASLIFRTWKPGDSLQQSVFGTIEPSSNAPAYDPEILMVPVLAFDGRGHRLGYGAGHYDRTINALQKRKVKPLTIGVAFEVQRVNELPMASYDESLDWVVTEEKGYKFI